MTEQKRREEGIKNSINKPDNHAHTEGKKSVCVMAKYTILTRKISCMRYAGWNTFTARRRRREKKLWNSKLLFEKWHLCQRINCDLVYLGNWTNNGLHESNEREREDERNIFRTVFTPCSAKPEEKNQQQLEKDDDEMFGVGQRIKKLFQFLSQQSHS